MGDLSKRIIGKYQIHYLQSNTIQVKNFIFHEDYLESKEIFSTLDPSDKKYWDDTHKLRKLFLKPYGDFFTHTSPLAQSMFSGILDCNGQKIEVKFKKL